MAQNQSPWIVDDCGNHLVIGYVRPDGEWITIARTPERRIEAQRVRDRFAKPTETDVANARMMGAAPDMLEALRRLEWSGRSLEIGVRRCPACGQSEENPHTPACFIRAAIAKATGEQS